MYVGGERGRKRQVGKIEISPGGAAKIESFRKRMWGAVHSYRRSVSVRGGDENDAKKSPDRNDTKKSPDLKCRKRELT